MNVSLHQRRHFHKKPLLLLLLILTLHHLTTKTLASVVDNYCGKDWVNAANACPLHCPSGDDTECTTKLGEGFGCFLFTGCHDRVEAGEFGDRDPVDEEEEEEVEEEKLPVERTRFCGVDFIEAMLTCDEGKRCPMGDECGGGDVCVENTNCDRPLVVLDSEIVFTFTGTTTPMEDEDWDIFNQVIFDLLKSTTIDLNIHLESITLIKQKSYEDTNTVEVDVLLRAKYRPPPEKKFSTIAENTFNLQKDTVRANLKKVGAEAKRYYFTTEVKEIGVVSKENATNRPTLSPTDSPTLKPTNVPSLVPSPSPSALPTSSPSDEPSSIPSREHVQEIITATTNEIKNIDDTSHGFLVNMRTKDDSPVLLINGLEFYTETTETVGFEVWSKLGSFEGFEGTYDGWDIVATGMVKGAGYGRYTPIPPELFTPVSIPGGGGAKGTRAFYLTLNSKDLVIKLGKSQSNSGATDNRVMASSPDLEIYNGKAVLSYPFPNPAETWFYHSPRVFLGVVTYDRLPCKPFSLYGPVDELPCGDVPTMKPTLKPTIFVEEEKEVEVEDETIANPAPTLKPTPKPTQLVVQTSPPSTSFPPTISIFPTKSIAPSMTPTASPVASIKVRIIVTLHNTPDILMNQEEQGMFIDTLVQFLNEQSGKAMVVNGIDVESEEMVVVTASPASTQTVMTPSTPAVATNVSSTINTTNTTSTSTEVARNTLGQRRLREVPGVRLIVILKVISTTLPHNLLGDMAVVAVEENQIDLVERFVRVGLDYPYFEKIDRVASFSADVPGVQSGASSTSKKSIESGVDTYVRGTDDASSVNIALLVSLFWCTLAVVSIVLLTKARSKIRNDNIEIENAGEPESDEHSDTAFRTSILRLIPLGSDVESAAKGSRRSLLSRSSRQSRTTGSGSLEKSLRDESFHYDNSLRDSSHRRSGLRSSMRQSLTMSQILGMSSEDDAPVRSSGVRRSGTAMRASMRRSMTNSNHGNLEDDALNDLIRAAEQETITNSNHDSVKGDDAPLRHSSVRRSGTAMRASMRRSMNNPNHDRLKDDDAPLRRTNDTSLRSSVRRSTNEANLRGSVRRSGSDSNLRGSVRRNTNEASLRGSGHDGMKDNDTRLGSSGVRRSGTAMRSSLRQSVTKANNDSLKDNDAKDGNALNISRTRNNLSKSVVFDDNLPSLIESDKGEEEQLEKPIINLDSEARTEEGENESRKVPERGQRKPSKLSQSMTAKDTMSFGISEEKKEEPIRLKNNLYKPQRMRRSGNEGSLRGSTNRGSADNLAGSDSDMGRLRRSENRGSSDNPRSMAKRAERRSLSQSISGDPSTTRRDSDGNTASLRRSNGARGSNDNLRGSTRRAPVANGLTDSTTLRRSSDGDSKDDNANLKGSVRTRTNANDTNLRSSVRRSTNEANLRGSVRTRRESDGNTASLRRSNGARGSNDNLRGSTRRAPVANGQKDSTTLRRSSDVDNKDDKNLRGSARTSTTETNLRSSVRRSTNEANLRGSVRRNGDVSNLRGSVRTRASTNEASLRGSVRRTTNEANLRGSVRRNSDGNDSPRAGSARTNEQQRSAGPRTREIV